MEPLSTMHSGASLAQQYQPLRLKALAAQANQLTHQGQMHGNRVGSNLSLKLKGQPSSNPENKNKELMEVARKFEAILIHQMLKAMRKTVHKSDLLNSFSLEQYESMLDEEIANEMAKHKGIGLADHLFHQLSRLENGPNPASSISNNYSRVNPYE